MKRQNTKAAITALMLSVSCHAMAQGTLDDYNRAYSLSQTFSADSVLNWARNVSWRDSLHVFTYQVNTAEGRKYIVYDADQKKSDAYDTKEAMDNALGIKPRKEEAQWSHFRRGRERHWMEVDEENEQYPVVSPDGKREAYIEGYNVVIHNVGEPYHTKRILTMDGTIGMYYSNRIQWSPDGSRILVCKRRPVKKRYAYYVESSPSTQLQPILHKQEYAKPGDELPQHYPVIIDVSTGKAVVADISQIDNQYALEWLRWSEDGKEVTMEYNQRGHHLYRLLAMDAATGSLRTIVEESASTFVNYPRLWRQFINDGRQLLWMSERDNWNHLYLYDTKTAKVIRQITKGPWCIREIQHVDETLGVVYFTACGMNPKEDPYHIHYYKIGIDGKNLVDLTPENGSHHATYSFDRRYLVDTYSTVASAPVTVLRDATDGSLIQTLATADISRLKSHGWQAPEV